MADQSEEKLVSANYIECSDDLVSAEQGFLLADHKLRWKDWQPPEQSTAAQDSETQKIVQEAPWTGIALSGGGIRSATFCLGALQAFAASGILRRADYISSVSGGGYTASALQWWWSRKRVERENKDPRQQTKAVLFDTDGDFPYGTQHPDPSVASNSGRTVQDTQALSFLRAHGRYLTPGYGIDIWSGMAVVFRTLLLNSLIWFPLAVVAISIPLLGEATLVKYFAIDGKVFWEPVPSPLPFFPGTWQDPNGVSPVIGALRMPLFFGFAFYIAYSSVVLFTLWTILLAYVSSIRANTQSSLWGGLVGAALGALFLGLAVYSFRATSQSRVAADWVFIASFGIVGLASLLSAWAKWTRSAAVDLVYAWVRGFDRKARICLLVMLVAALFGLVPFAPYYFATNKPPFTGPSLAGLAALGSGVAAAMQGYSTLVTNTAGGLAGRVLAPLGVGIFFIFILIDAYVVAVAGIKPCEVIFNLDNNCRPASAPVEAIKIWFWSTILFGFALSWIVRVNAIGLHRFYRDRVMEAFMPSTRTISGSEEGISPIADRFSISDILADAGPPQAVPTPFPIINTNVILVHDSDPDFSERGGDSFALTPYYVGSRATGWAKTTHYESLNGPVTLASAMTASGAAANANAAYVGVGVTRNRLVSLFMSLLNLRLGLWLANPKKSLSCLAWRRPNNLYAGLACGLLNRGYRSNSNLVELSDGGHFDNLGLYELVRRRVRVVFVVDAEADSKTDFPALTSVLRRISKDFKGTKITFISGKGLERLAANVPCAYPNGAMSAKWPYFVAGIEYPKTKTKAQSTGVVIYCKAAIVADLSVAVRGYLALHPSFPHESTIDQFFSPEQFEAYRELGYEIVWRTITELDLTKLLADPEAIIGKFAA